MPRPHILLCTVGSSLFHPNLDGLARALADGSVADDRRPLAAAYRDRDDAAVARELLRLPPAERLAGAEINSVARLIDQGLVAPDCGLFFLHSDTDDGRRIAGILQDYYRGRHAPVETVAVAGLQDQDPHRFRTQGLRNLARGLCKIIRDYSPAACAVNATGGYKAQIAVAVLLGLALGVPVYYMHERFTEIIAFPPMPVALDLEVWMRAAGLLYDLERSPEPVPAERYAEDWDEKYESLVERVRIDGQEYLELSPAGQIFHETFRERFRSGREQLLPPPAPAGRKRPPRLEKAGWPGQHPEVERFLQQLTDDVPCVVGCTTFYYNPDLPERSRFRLGGDGIEGVYSPGGFTVKFRVETTARTPEQQAAAVAALSEWLAEQEQR